VSSRFALDYHYTLTIFRQTFTMPFVNKNGKRPAPATLEPCDDEDVRVNTHWNVKELKKKQATKDKRSVALQRLHDNRGDRAGKLVLENSDGEAYGGSEPESESVDGSESDEWDSQTSIEPRKKPRITAEMRHKAQEAGKAKASVGAAALSPPTTTPALHKTSNTVAHEPKATAHGPKAVAAESQVMTAEPDPVAAKTKTGAKRTIDQSQSPPSRDSTAPRPSKKRKMSSTLSQGLNRPSTPRNVTLPPLAKKRKTSAPSITNPPATTTITTTATTITKKQSTPQHRGKPASIAPLYSGVARPVFQETYDSTRTEISVGIVRPGRNNFILSRAEHRNEMKSAAVPKRSRHQIEKKTTAVLARSPQKKSDFDAIPIKPTSTVALADTKRDGRVKFVAHPMEPKNRYKLTKP